MIRTRDYSDFTPYTLHLVYRRSSEHAFNNRCIVKLDYRLRYIDEYAALYAVPFAVRCLCTSPFSLSICDRSIPPSVLVHPPLPTSPS